MLVFITKPVRTTGALETSLCSLHVVKSDALLMNMLGLSQGVLDIIDQIL